MYDILDEPELVELATKAIGTLELAFAQLPDEWFSSDDERKRMLSDITTRLNRVGSKEFWSSIV